MSDLAKQFDSSSSWKGHLQLEYQQRGSRTVISRRRQIGPLNVQRPFYPEEAVCHTYLLHPPGGVVAGDSLKVDIKSLGNSRALVTTPGATKFYRSLGKTAYVDQQLQIEDGAMLEWLPQENIFFPGSQAQINTDIHLQGSARCIAWEMQCFGRPALQERFSTGCILGRTRVYRDNKLVLNERLAKQGFDQHQSCAGMRDYPMLATMIISSDDTQLFESLNESLQKINAGISPKRLILGITCVDGLIVVRAMAVYSEDILRAYVKMWQITREHWFGVIPLAPRIWAT
ncbi:urease accessory protein UreD [Alginatibacterium sediminis]|uniref:Urease accessory protein UreD n=1 Tax=Alginatibacterium sediminis TaxID=2164068 RepID=A0A420E5E3_9ALTE|nr:urease accessory protein UreD [Alginatibacterium sediminis]RKF12793.1 urease accessory protein UreD [Alginatibacterium sediminis]